MGGEEKEQHVTLTNTPNRRSIPPVTVSPESLAEMKEAGPLGNDGVDMFLSTTSIPTNESVSDGTDPTIVVSEDKIDHDGVNPTKPPRRKVSFSDTTVRSYRRTLGDHPDVAMGPPISFDWNPVASNTLSVDEFESSKSNRRRRSHNELRMHPDTRFQLAKEAGNTEEEIRKATKSAQKAQRQRVLTTALQPVVGPLEEAVQSAKRKLGRRMKRSTSAPAVL